VQKPEVRVVDAAIQAGLAREALLQRKALDRRGAEEQRGSARRGRIGLGKFFQALECVQLGRAQ